MTTTTQPDFEGMLRHWRRGYAQPLATYRRGPSVDSVVLPRLLRAEEVAEGLGVTADFIYALARRDEIPHVRIGRTVRFRADVIDEWLRANLRGTIPEAS